MDAHQLAQGNPDRLPESRLGRDIALVELGLADTQPGAVFQGELEETLLGARIAGDRRGEADGESPSPVDVDGLSVNLDLDDFVVQAEEASREPVAIHQPHDFRRARLGAYAVGERIQLVTVGRRLQDQTHERIERDIQLAQFIGLNLQGRLGRRPDHHAHQAIAVGKDQMRAIERRERCGRFVSELEQAVQRQLVLGALGGNQRDRRAYPVSRLVPRACAHRAENALNTGSEEAAPPRTARRRACRRSGPAPGRLRSGCDCESG